MKRPVSELVTRLQSVRISDKASVRTSDKIAVSELVTRLQSVRISDKANVRISDKTAECQN